MNVEQLLSNIDTFSERLFGVEIEVYNISQSRAAQVLTAAGIDCRREEYNHEARTWWKTVPDGSLPDNSAEVVSPPLPFNKESLEQVAKVIQVLKDNFAQVNRSCGLHVHVNARNVARYQDFAYLLYQRYRINELAIDKFIAEHRRGNNSQSYARTLEYNPLTYNHIMSHVSRGSKINLHSYPVHGTVEFRHHEGCLNETKVVSWIAFCVGFFEDTLKFHNETEGPRAELHRALNRARVVTY